MNPKIRRVKIEDIPLIGDEEQLINPTCKPKFSPHPSLFLNLLSMNQAPNI